MNNQQSLSGLTAVSFESRMALPMARLIEQHGGRALQAPTMKEEAITDHSHIFQFYEDLKKGDYPLLVILTGVALRSTLKVLETNFSKEEILDTFRNKTKIIVRGPKPLVICKQNQIPVLSQATEPHTWREIVSIFKNDNSLPKGALAILEYGISNQELIADLGKLGFLVKPVQIYEWQLPDDLSPLKTAIQEIIDGHVDLTFFTSANQVDHLFKIVSELNLEPEFRRAMQAVAIFSIGPVCSGRLASFQIFPDAEARPNKLVDLLQLAANKAPDICKLKKERTQKAWVQIESPLDISSLPTNDELVNSYFLKACRKEPVKKIPIWLMRQAGRYMAEYQLVRKNSDFLTLCKKPELAANATISALERLGVDAAIIFSDILIPLEPIGFKLHFHEKIGPLIDNPLRNTTDFDGLNFHQINQSCQFLFESIRLVRSSIKTKIPLIGFSGAPFTLASYMIEGKSSRNFIPTKVIMNDQPELWDKIMSALTEVLIDYLNTQIEAGCQVVQIFDSWVGNLDRSNFLSKVLPYTKKLIAGIKKNIPVIYFGTNTNHLIDDMTLSGCQVIGVDTNTDIKLISDKYKGKLAFQGNFDPVLLFSSKTTIKNKTIELLDAVGKTPGYIFNLGHGILPETPVDHVLTLIDTINEWSEKNL